jgi:hypothetical protein
MATDEIAIGHRIGHLEAQTQEVAKQIEKAGFGNFMLSMSRPMPSTVPQPVVATQNTIRRHTRITWRRRLI